MRKLRPGGFLRRPVREYDWFRIDIARLPTERQMRNRARSRRTTTMDIGEKRTLCKWEVYDTQKYECRDWPKPQERKELPPSQSKYDESGGRLRLYVSWSWWFLPLTNIMPIIEVSSCYWIIRRRDNSSAGCKRRAACLNMGIREGVRLPHDNAATWWHNGICEIIGVQIHLPPEHVCIVYLQTMPEPVFRHAAPLSPTICFNNEGKHERRDGNIFRIIAV